jgi:uncharacterized protein (TIGR00369 family)
MAAKPVAFGVVAPEVLLSHDGLSLLQALIDGEVPSPPITQTLAFRLISVARGEAIFSGEPRHEFYNPLGSVHGGYAATLLDSAASCAVHTTLSKGEAYTTLELKINFVRPLTAQAGPVTAEGRVIHRGRTVATAEAYLKDGSGRLYAHGTATCVIFPAGG